MAYSSLPKMSIASKHRNLSQKPKKLPSVSVFFFYFVAISTSYIFHCNEMTQVFTCSGTCQDQQSRMNGISQFWTIGFYHRN